MPSKSKAQHNLMEGVAHNAAFAKKVGIPQSVGRDFAEADKGKKFSKGGTHTQPKRQSINQPKTQHGEQALFKQGGIMATKMGKPTMKAGMSMAKDGMKKPTPMAGMMGMKKGGMHKMPDGKMMKNSAMKKMADGGMPMVMKDGEKVPAFAADGKGKMNMGGMAKKMNMGGMAKGGGIESKGKTKGKQISMSGNKGMKSGGMAKKYC
jgi:hypothetical protein